MRVRYNSNRSTEGNEDSKDEIRRTNLFSLLPSVQIGPGGTGNRVRISGYELWKIDNEGRIGESKGHFDSADYERQLKGK